MVLILSAVTLIAIAFLMAKCLQLSEMATVRRGGNRILRVELRRRIEMRTHADGLGGYSFPQPAETRILSWHFCALPVWSLTESIGLPASCEGLMNDIRPEDFDQHFTPAFKQAGQQKSTRPRSSRTAAA